MTARPSAIAAGLLALSLQTPQFRSGIDIVRFDVFVLDKARHPVGGLTAGDFRVTEDAQPLRIAGFETVTIPAGTAPTSPATTATAPAPADLRVETVTNQRNVPGRLVIIVMDRSIGNEQPIVTARKVANAAIDALGPNDLAAVVFTSGISGNRLQGLTANRDRLRAAVASAQMGAPTGVAMTPGGLTRTGPGLPAGECYCGICTMQTLAGVADAIAPVPNYKKMLLYIGEDLPFAENSAAGTEGGCRGLFREARERLMRAIDRSSLTVHAFNPHGLETGALGADASPADARETASSRLIREDNLRAVREGNLRTLPDYTGGRTIIANQPEQFVAGIFEETRTYYVLAVERAPAHGNGRPHAVRIEVARPDASVVSRTTYLDVVPDATKKPSADPLERALAEVLPGTDVPLRMTLAPGSRKGSSLDVTLATPRTATQADVLVGVFDEFAKPVGHERARVDLPARNGADAEWTLHLNPKPGHYEVRAAVRIANTIGTIAGYVDVSEAPGRAATVPVTRSAARSAALDALLTQAGAYVEQFHDPHGGVLLHELYRQDVQSSPVGTRTLQSDLLIVPDETEGWVQFRDVLSIDGKKIADRQDRLLRLFSNPAADPHAQARRIAEESARYNLTSTSVTMKRSLNQPMAALLYLRPLNQPRSDFSLAGGGGDRRQVSFREQQQPTLIGTTGNAGATGDFWIDAATGLVRRADLRIVSRASNVTVTASIRVDYELDAKSGLALPVTMVERYQAQDPRGNPLEAITGEARYSNPRRFTVTTDAR
jgi:VWFA-related protein